MKKTEPRTVTFLPIRQIFKKKTDVSNISENTNKSLGIISHTETEEGSIPMGGKGEGALLWATANRSVLSSIGVALKVHKIEIFFGFDFEICIISLLVMSKY